MAFWWASQGKNYPTAIDDGTLWTCNDVRGKLNPDRSRIFDVRPGDTVFHYYGPNLRAVSTVRTSWVDAPPPPGYDASIDGWLVYVDPIRTDLMVDRDRVAQLIAHGSPGPLDRNGSPAQKYLSPLSIPDSIALLREIDLQAGPLTPPELATPSGTGGATDVAVSTTARAEQSGLRGWLLGGRAEAPCDLCGRSMPSSFLVAAHIKRRSACDEKERWDFPAIAMLACSLGCDALFEAGVILVSESGEVQHRRDADHPALASAAALIVGRQCTAFDSRRANAFKWHRQLPRRFKSAVT